MCVSVCGYTNTHTHKFIYIYIPPVDMQAYTMVLRSKTEIYLVCFYILPKRVSL